MKIQLINMSYNLRDGKPRTKGVLENARAYLNKVGTLMFNGFLISDAYKDAVPEQLEHYLKQFSKIKSPDEYLLFAASQVEIEDSPVVVQYCTDCLVAATQKHRWKLMDKARTFFMRHGADWSTDPARRQAFNYLVDRLATMRHLVDTDDPTVAALHVLERGLQVHNHSVIKAALDKIYL